MLTVKIESFKDSKVYDNNLNYIYLLEITHGIERFHKIGITYQNPVKRIENIKCTSNKCYNSKILWSTDKIVRTCDAVEIEKNMALKYKNSKYSPTIKFSGYTECYIFDDINTVIASLEVAIQDKDK